MTQPSEANASAGTLGRVVVLLVIAEVICLLASFVLPGELYLGSFVNDAAEDAVTTFLEGDALLVPDSVTGWRSAPDQRREQWVTDGRGMRRSTREWGEGSTPLRVLALGSSMVNGGTRVSPDETLTAYLETDDLRAFNHGTMLYGVDQSLLAFQSRLADVRTDIVLLGVDAEPTGPLVNVYIPLRQPGELNMPFVKPRYHLVDGVLTRTEESPNAVLAAGGVTLLDYFSEHDAYRWRFTAHKLGFTPVNSFIQYVVGRARALGRRFRGPPEADERLLDAVLAEFDAAVGARSASLVILAMPPGRADMAPMPGTPDLFAERLERWSGQGFNVVDGRAALLEAPHALGALFGPDGGHLSPLGNEVVAEAVRRQLPTAAAQASTNER